MNRIRKLWLENFSILCDCYYQNLVSKRENGHYAMSPSKFDIFLIFYIFLRFHVFSFFGNLSQKLYIQIVVLHIKFYFTWGELDLYWKIVKFQNFMTRINRKSFLYFLQFQWLFKILEKWLIWLNIVISIQKLLIRKVESFLKSNWNVDQTSKTMLTQNQWIWNSNAIPLFDLPIKDRIKAFQLWKMSTVSRRIGKTITKNLFAQTIPEKMFSTK